MTTIAEAYLKEINRAYLNGDATEHTHRPALKTLVESLKDGITATNEPRQTACGAPDMKVSRRVGRSEQAFGYIECKDIGVDLKKAEKSDQLKRYLGALDNLIFTDYIQFRLYRSGELVETAILAKEGAGGKYVSTEDSLKDVQKLFAAFFAAEPVRVRSAEELAKRMAGLGQLLRGVIEKSFDKESDHGALHGQYEAFKKVLLHDMKEEEFADMYAQTICYGLFAARCYLSDEAVWGKDMHAIHHGIDGKRGEFTIEKASYLLPKTNPFLRNIFGDIAGPGMDERIAWVVADLVALLREAQMDAVLKGFGRSTKRTDPVIHFYETFLAAYDPKLRESRGVYYTPEPVVSYIVRSVDWLLKEKFGLKQGLADKKKIKLQTPSPLRGTPPLQGESYLKEVHRCLVLDPAAGTGTFLHEVIRLIHKGFKDKGAWNAYVKEHLLPRVFGFELMMAPYAICHMKLGLELADTGYDFGSDERLGVYLTNTLEEAEDASQYLGFARNLAIEATEANKVKKDLPIMVVLGNPPYSGHSANASWKLNEKGKKVKNFIGGLVDDYYFVDGQPLGEKNPKWLQDDYVKFIRYGQHRIEQTGSGILAFITNHGYLDNPTFRGMRQQLMKTFSDIYILDLHGNSKKKEVCPDGSPDKNVFDIQQGVSIGIFVKEPDAKGEAKVHHAELWGERKSKYTWLYENELKNTKWTVLRPRKDFYLYKTQDTIAGNQYTINPKITDIFQVNGWGVATRKDYLLIDFSQKDLRQHIDNILHADVETAYTLGVKDNAHWSFRSVKDKLGKQAGDRIYKYNYRPFDERSIFYEPLMIERGDHRYKIAQHFLKDRENLALLTSRVGSAVGSPNWDILFCSNKLSDLNLFRRGGAFIFTLYLYPEEQEESGRQRTFGDREQVWPSGPDGRVPNLDKGFVDELAEKTGLGFVSDGRGDLGEKVKGKGEKGGTFGPEDVFAWIYGVFHSPQYRTRYAEFLKIDFPRVPMPKDGRQFAEVCAVGHELAALHLMESAALEKSELRPGFGVEGDMLVESGYPKYDGGKVYINEKQYFKGIREDVWGFMIGGYQVCEKWLKDRRGRTLSYDDVEHYQKICVALGETIRLMGDKRLEIFE
jgi:uncharacterized protein YktA (UPF0223 family)